MICLENLLSHAVGTILQSFLPLVGWMSLLVSKSKCIMLPTCPCVVPLINVQTQSKIYSEWYYHSNVNALPGHKLLMSIG